MLPITTLAACILTLIFVFLTLRVINMRRNGTGPSVGLNEDDQFLRAVRSHGNFIEYTPLFLILLGLAELQVANPNYLIFISILFVVGRLLHLVGFGFIGTGPWRTLGMVCSNTALLLMVVLLASVAVA